MEYTLFLVPHGKVFEELLSANVIVQFWWCDVEGNVCRSWQWMFFTMEKFILNFTDVFHPSAVLSCLFVGLLDVGGMSS